MTLSKNVCFLFIVVCCFLVDSSTTATTSDIEASLWSIAQEVCGNLVVGGVITVKY